MFYDLNIPWTSDAKVALQLAALEEMGYGAVAINHTVEDRVPKTKCPFGRLSYKNTNPKNKLKQYTRLTLILRDGDQNTGMNNATSNDVLSSYDILAVQPESERALHAACTSIDIDIICIDFSIRMPFPLKAGLLRQALARGIAFEITYAPIVSDAASRKAIIGNVSALLRFGFSSRDSRIIRGGLLVSSDADMPWKLRPPQDVCNLLGIMGVPAHARKTCLTDAAEKIILHAASRKYTFRGVVIPPPVLDRRSEDSDLLEDFIELK